VKIQRHITSRGGFNDFREEMLFFFFFLFWGGDFLQVYRDGQTVRCRGVIRGIQDLRVEIEDVVGELTRWVSTRRKDIRYRLLVQVDEKLSRFRRWMVNSGRYIRNKKE